MAFCFITFYINLDRLACITLQLAHAESSKTWLKGIFTELRLLLDEEEAVAKKFIDKNTQLALQVYREQADSCKEQLDVTSDLSNRVWSIGQKPDPVQRLQAVEYEGMLPWRSMLFSLIKWLQGVWWHSAPWCKAGWETGFSSFSLVKPHNTESIEEGLSRCKTEHMFPAVATPTQSALQLNLAGTGGWDTACISQRHPDPCVPTQAYTAAEQEMQRQMSLGELCHPVPLSFEPIRSYYKGLVEAMQSTLQMPLDIRLKETPR
ncbi:hypothetical protein P7K49_001421 [Saguinus oedipus]|uniref:Uncharacterized protein n=1 Tax=Saguinus oedipus TaxID=9490 RepID=A0ABQ9WEE8_SAGOE|nr:hypothetical protein P7K49_001421 [Saguinus oedipus]